MYIHIYIYIYIYICVYIYKNIYIQVSLFLTLDLKFMYTHACEFVHTIQTYFFLIMHKQICI